MMTTTTTQERGNISQIAGQSDAANGLAMVRLTIGAMFVWVFFENLGKGLYTPAGYAGLINYYIKTSHSPAAWKAVMGLAASHAAMAAPMQAADRDLARHPARPRSAHAPGRLCCIPVPRAAFGSRSGARRGSGSCWFRCWHRSGSRSDARVVRGASTRCWRGGAPSSPWW